MLQSLVAADLYMHEAVVLSVGLQNQDSASSTGANRLFFLLAQGLPLLCYINEVSLRGLNGEGSESPLHFQINLRAACKVDSVESGPEVRSQATGQW